MDGVEADRRIHPFRIPMGGFNRGLGSIALSADIDHPYSGIQRAANHRVLIFLKCSELGVSVDVNILWSLFNHGILYLNSRSLTKLYRGWRMNEGKKMHIIEEALRHLPHIQQGYSDESCPFCKQSTIKTSSADLQTKDYHLSDEEIADFASNTADPETADKILRHLQLCSDCSEFIQTVRDAFDVFKLVQKKMKEDISQ